MSDRARPFFRVRLDRTRVVGYGSVDLPALIRARRAHPDGGSLRDMEARAHSQGHEISRSALSDYERGRIKQRPGRERVEALASALGCSFGEVAAAVEETWRLENASPAEPWHVKRWRALVSGRSPAEVEELLLIDEQILRMRDLDSPDGAGRRSPESL